ncbi:MAG: hypothetical protein WKF59_03840 [Chitinophagaceae bacterium]
MPTFLTLTHKKILYENNTRITIRIFLNVSAVNAQTNNSSDYKTALGVKFYPTGVTIKHFISAKHALEGLGYFYNEGARITGKLYEIYGDINNAGG